jgi:hypothetical protein
MSTKKKNAKAPNKMEMAWKKFRKHLPKNDILVKCLAGFLAFLMFLSVFASLLY